MSRAGGPNLARHPQNTSKLPLVQIAGSHWGGQTMRVSSKFVGKTARQVTRCKKSCRPFQIFFGTTVSFVTKPAVRGARHLNPQIQLLLSILCAALNTQFRTHAHIQLKRI